MNKKIFLIVITILFYFLITNITSTLNGFYNGTNIILTLLFMVIIYGYLEEKNKVSFTSYILFILIFLLFREKSQDNINLNFYFFDWIRLVRTNKIVFINIFGNLFLFIPLVFYLDNKYIFLKSVAFILFLEILQLITKRGVFDIVDIFLNLIGIIFGLIIKRSIYGREKQKRSR